MYTTRTDIFVFQGLVDVVVASARVRGEKEVISCGWMPFSFSFGFIGCLCLVVPAAPLLLRVFCREFLDLCGCVCCVVSLEISWKLERSGCFAVHCAGCSVIT